MKTVLMGAIAALFVAGSATAQDFNDTQAFVDVEVGKLTFGIEASEQSGFTGLEFDYEVLAYPLGAGTSTLDLGVTYFDSSETITIDAIYAVRMPAAPTVDVYGSVELNYVASSELAVEGDVFGTPEVGVEWYASDTTSMFGEVGYVFNLSDDVSNVGAYAEVGMNWDVADNITFTPSVVHTFDGPGADVTEARVGLTLKF